MAEIKPPTESRCRAATVEHIVEYAATQGLDEARLLNLLRGVDEIDDETLEEVIDTQRDPSTFIHIEVV